MAREATIEESNEPAPEPTPEPTLEDLEAQLQTLEARHEVLKAQRKALADQIARLHADERVTAQIRGMSQAEFDSFQRLSQTVQPDGFDASEEEEAT